ncbi:MAG TPA: SLC13 family permease [Anaerolineales bacterium]
MTFEIGLMLFIIVAAVVLFATEKLRVDVIAMLVLLTLALTGLVTPEQAFSGFSSPAVITVWAVYIV